MTAALGTVFVVDDDDSVRVSLERLIRAVGLRVETFSSALKFKRRLPVDGPGCVVLDIRMPGLSGLDLQDELGTNDGLPIIFVTGHGDVQMSVRAMKAGAVDFLEKPYDEERVLSAINRALEQSRSALQEIAAREEIQRRVDSLTAREREVFALVVRGKLNKQIAAELGTTEKTVKVHRAHVVDKMQAASLADLVRMAERVKRG
ncbi:MAG: response regulator transcription factor [Gemmatimonadales bacterium]